MRKILLIDAHPDKDRLTSSLVDAARCTSKWIRRKNYNHKRYEFNPNLKFG